MTIKLKSNLCIGPVNIFKKYFTLLTVIFKLFICCHVVRLYETERGLHHHVTDNLENDAGRVDSRFAPSQWKTSLQNDTVSHWLGANLESALIMCVDVTTRYHFVYLDKASGTYFITGVDFIHGTLCPFVLVVQLCMKFWTNYVHGSLMVSTPAAGIRYQTNLAVAFSLRISKS